MDNSKMPFKKVEGTSVNLIKQNIESLRKLFPEIASDGKIDFNQLRVLLGDSVDDSEEKYKFTWHGKQAAMRLAQRMSTATLRPQREKSLLWDKTKNLYIEGDNLESLKLLQKSYSGKIKFIYIDPPYNTGHDFVYHDDFRDSIQNYLEITGQVDQEGNRLSTNLETSGRFHSDWLSMMYPRLQLARNLLREDGVIAMSIDDGELENLRKISKEIFGENNFLGQITYLNNPKGRSQDKYLATSSEYILLFSKTVLPSGAISISKGHHKIDKQYPYKDQAGQYRLIELRNTHREFGKYNRPNLYYPIYIDRDGKVLEEEDNKSIAVLPIWNDGFEGCWTWGKDKFLKEKNLLIAKKQQENWKIYRKDYVKQDGQTLTKVQTLLTDKAFHTEKGQAVLNSLFGSTYKIFQSPKSVDLLQLLVEMGTDRHGIVMDFFSGSATMAQAVLQQNIKDGGDRRFIMIQLPEKTPEDSVARTNGFKTITDIGEERIRRVRDELRASDSNRSIDAGFRVFRLDTSNLVQWDDLKRNQLLLLDENFKADRSSEDILFEIILKQGLDLNSSVISREIEGATIYSVSGGSVYIVLGDQSIKSTVADEIANLYVKSKMEHSTVIFQDSGFASDSEKLNSIKILNDAGFQYANIKSI